MSQKQYASGKYAIAICDICGFRYPLLELRMEPISAYGSPSNAPSNLMACPTCYDPPHPQSFLDLAVQAAGSDAQQLRNPRTDIFPKAFPIKYTLLNQLYNNGTNPLTLARGFGGLIKAAGTFAGYSATATPPVGITVHSVTLPSPSYAVLSISVDPAMAVGEYLMNIVDQQGNSTAGQLLIV